MSAKHQENDTPVKASHLLLVIAVCQVLVPEHCLLGEPPNLLGEPPKLESKGKRSIQVLPSHDSAIGCRREGPTCSGSRTHPSPKRSQVGVHVVLPQGSIPSFQNFWNQSQLMKIRREIYSQSRIKACRIRMRQFISPLIVIST